MINSQQLYSFSVLFIFNLELNVHFLLCTEAFARIVLL